MYSPEFNCIACRKLKGSIISKLCQVRHLDKTHNIPKYKIVTFFFDTKTRLSMLAFHWLAVT